MTLGDRKSPIATVGVRKQQAIFNVYKDAAKILEELLNSRISDDVKGHKKVRRIKTGPHHEKEASHPVDTTVRRSRTLPGNYRESTEDLREKDKKPTPELDNVLDNNDGLLQKNTEASLLIVSNGKDVRLSDEVVKGNLNNRNYEAYIASSGSSADTEEDSTNVTQKRKKKSLLKRTKERILQAFHRDEKSRNSTATVKASPTAAKSSKSKQDKAYKDSEPTKTNGKHSGTADSSKGQLKNSPSSTARRKTNFFSSFRRGKKSSKANANDENISKVENNGPELKALDLAAYTQTEISHRDSGVPSSHPENKHSEPHLSLPHEKLPRQQNAKVQLSSSDGVASMGTENLTKNTIKNDPVYSGKKPTSLKLEHIRSHKQSDPSAFPKPPPFTGQESIQSSVLDSPGEDIEFIDAFQPAMIFPCPPVCSGPSHDARFQSLHSPSSIRDVQTQALSFPDEIDGFNYEAEAAGGEDKEAQYKLIAQKLAEMGDSLMHESDLSNKSDTIEPVDITLLASEITEHLRAVGDRVTEQTTQDLYRRFYSTVQNSLGHEVSWNHVAFLYNAIKDVVSAFGKGSRAAVMAKEWTLKYVSDTMADWIIDQGGFGNLLSSDESDFGVD